MSNNTEFVDAVTAMRKAQVRYFRNRKAIDLDESRRLEAAVDKLLDGMRGGVYRSAHPLFDREDEPHA